MSALWIEKHCMDDIKRWVLPCPLGCEELLRSELEELGVCSTEVAPSVVMAQGPLSDGYRLVVGSRIASRVLLTLKSWNEDGEEALYRELREVDWGAHLHPFHTFAISFSQASGLSNPGHYWVQRAKDALVDTFRSEGQSRPNVDKKDADIRFHVHVGKQEHSLLLDFSAGGQHRRGYRIHAGEAPLKENLAAAILRLARWPEHAAAGEWLVDPTCGSGTLVIEAALMATHTAPGLIREEVGPISWLQHDRALLDEELLRARQRQTDFSGAVFGYDSSQSALRAARQNARVPDVNKCVRFIEKSVQDVEKPSGEGIIVCNPPYGHRLGDEQTLFLFYQQLGDSLKRAFGGSTAYVFVAAGRAQKHLGLRPSARHVLHNGPIECRLLEVPIRAPSGSSAPGWRKPSQDASMFANRVRKNARKWRRFAKTEHTNAYRLYDCEIPEYRVAVDRYPDHALVHVYSRGKQLDAALLEQRLQDVLLTLPDVIDVPKERIIVKVRHKQSEGDQYVRSFDGDEQLEVNEGGVRYVVNLRDRIDTGLFLDHRNVRMAARQRSQGKHVLNLFAYTCSVSVAAAVGGAARTTNVDLSKTYLDWGKQNFERNGLDLEKHRFFRADLTNWSPRKGEQFDWIFVNPPTFSRSKMARGVFHVVRDHEALIDRSMRALRPTGELLFTTHAHEFELHASIRERFDVENVSKSLVPQDFARSPFSAFAVRPAASRRSATSRT